MLPRLARWTLLVSLALAVVLHADALASNNLLPRRVGFHFATVMACALALFQRSRATPWPLAGLALWSLFAWAVSPVSGAAVVGLVDVIAASTLCLAIASSAVPRRQLLLLFVALGLGGAALGLLEQYVSLPLSEATRPAGWFASRATAAAFVAATLPLLWGWVGRPTWLAPVATAVQFAFIISTRARIAWVAAVVAILAVAFIYRRSAPRVLAAGVAGLIIAVALTPGPMLRWTSDTPYANSAATLSALDLGIRRVVWPETARMALRRPWGWGPGSFEAAFAPAAPSETPTQLRIESPHNEPLRLAFELGLPGLVLTALLLSGLLRRASRRTWLLRASTLALLLCALVGKTMAEPPTAVLACCLVGLQLRTVRVRALAGPRWKAVLAPLFVVALVTAVVDARQVAASRVLAQGQALARNGQLRAAWETAGPTLADHHDLGPWGWAIELLAQAGDERRCRAVAADALVRYPRRPLLLEWASRCGNH